MSSFNYCFSANTLRKSNCFGASRPDAITPSSLNPAALSYIPLNAGATPYVPLPTKINIPKTLHPPNKQCPSFAYYEQIKSSAIYNATSKYHDNNTFGLCSSCPSTDWSSTMSAPIPGSVTSLVCSECDSIDLENVLNIEPYVPSNRPDIDQIKKVNEEENHRKHRITSSISIISEDMNSSPHPVIAALNQTEYKELVNAPIWSPESVKHFAKIAIDEEDFQYIIHPNKKAIKYGLYYDRDTETTQIGESYDESMSSISSISSSSSNIAPAASIDSCYNNLYKSKTSRVAVEGYEYSETENNTTINTMNSPPKIALDINCEMTMPYYGELQSRIASPLIQSISYIYCTS